MPAVVLTSRMPVEIDGILHKIVGQPRSMIHLEAVESGDIVPISRDDLVGKIITGAARIKTVVASDPQRRARLEKKLHADLHALPETQRSAVERRLRYLKSVNRQMPFPKTKERLDPVIAEIAEKMGDTRPPNWTTVCRWLKDHEAASKDPRSQIPNYQCRGNRAPRFSEEVQQLIADGIDKWYLTKHRGTPQAVADYVRTRIHQINEGRDKSRRLSVPSKRTIYRKIEALDPHTCVARRYSIETADRMFRQVQAGPRVTRPLERMEIDHTVLDLMLIDETTSLPLGRPTLTIAIDGYSKMPLGFYVGFESAGGQSVMHCLRHAMLPKRNLRELYPDIVNDWPCHGVPEVLVVDNGREFHSADLEHACGQLGIEIQYSPRKQPWYKGSVERLFGTVNKRLLEGLPGYTFSNIADRDEYDPTKHACVFFDTFLAALTKWITDIYPFEFHRGLEARPIDVWQKGIEAHPGIRIPSSIEDLQITLSYIVTRTIQKYGIECLGICYSSEALSHLRQVHYRGKNPSVQFKLDPSDLGTIYVIHPDGGYLAVPAKDQGYAAGLRLSQHKYIRKWRNKVKRNCDESLSLAQARDQLRALMAEIKPRKKRVASARKLAKMEGTGSDNTFFERASSFSESSPLSVPVIEQEEPAFDVNEDYGVGEPRETYTEEELQEEADAWEASDW